jgi:hypothetical protein
MSGLLSVVSRVMEEDGLSLGRLEMLDEPPRSPFYSLSQPNA